MLYREVLRPLLFLRDAETAHRAVLERLGHWHFATGLAEQLLSVDDPRLHSEILGLHFRNPVGIGAGLDKHAEAVAAWRSLGFGFCEIGTVTPLPQDGNPLPRMFRLQPDEAIINRMGFNSLGADAVAANLQRIGRVGIPVGVNVGKNKLTPNEDAAADYERAIRVLAPFADYIAINLSSPNTPDLRALQKPELVEELVRRCVKAARPGQPVLLKVAPDFAPGELEDTVAAALQGGVAGFIASNTTITRDNLRSTALAAEAGGLSGKPLRDMATATVRRVFRVTKGKVPIIGVGGIASAEDAYEKILAGANLVQVYTGLIYEGPTLAAKINRGLLQLLERDGLANVAAAVGLDA